MSRLIETRKAYDKLADLLDQEIRNKNGDVKELQRYRENLDVAFYLLGFSQFEFLVKKEGKMIITDNSNSRLVDRHAWEFMKANIGNLSLRKILDVVFHQDPKIRQELDSDYSIRNEAAHNYQKLPGNARDISNWLKKLQNIISNF